MPIFDVIQDLTGKVQKKERYSFACGGFADIWAGYMINKDFGNTQPVAVKVHRDHDHNSRVWRRLLREARVWSTLSHRYITPLLGISYDFDRPGMPCLVSPYYRHGDVMAYIKEQENVDRLQIVTQVASALSYLHSLSIIHGDIKGSNILIDDEGSAVLTDFGLSRILETSGLTTKTLSGTLLRHMAVELHDSNEADGLVPQVASETDDEGSAALADIYSSYILKISGYAGKSASGMLHVSPEFFGKDQTSALELLPHMTANFLEPDPEDLNPSMVEGWRWKAPELMVPGVPRVTPKTDVWAFGMIVLEIFTQLIPFSHIRCDTTVIVFVMSGGRPEHRHCPQINKSIWRKLEECWDVDPSRRPSMDTLLRFLEFQTTTVASQRAML